MVGGRSHRWSALWVSVAIGGSLLSVMAASSDAPATSGEAAKAPALVEDPNRALDEMVFPGLARAMVQWPAPEVLSGSNLVSRDSDGRADAAREQSIEWIRKMLRTEWLPEDPQVLGREIVLVRREYGKLDATHVRWTKNGYTIQVSQTRGTIAIRLNPLAHGQVPETAEEKATYARGICRQLLPDDYMLERGGGDKKAVKLHSEIEDRSFSRAIVRQLSNGVVAGAAWRPFLEKQGVALGLPGRPPPAGPQATNRFLRTWWGLMGWFTDGRQLGLWTYKTEGADSRVNVGLEMGLFTDPDGASWF